MASGQWNRNRHGYSGSQLRHLESICSYSRFDPNSKDCKVCMAKKGVDFCPDTLKVRAKDGSRHPPDGAPNQGD